MNDPKHPLRLVSRAHPQGSAGTSPAPAGDPAERTPEQREHMRRALVARLSEQRARDVEERREQGRRERRPPWRVPVTLAGALAFAAVVAWLWLRPSSALFSDKARELRKAPAALSAQPRNGVTPQR